MCFVEKRMLNSQSNNTAPELPGFYFDPERNRYFRVLPGTNNHNPLTQRQIANKKHERRVNKKQKKCKRKRQNWNITTLLRRNEIGEQNYGPKSNFYTEIAKAKIILCEPSKCKTIKPGFKDQLHTDRDYVTYLQYNPTNNMLSFGGINYHDQTIPNIQISDGLAFTTEFDRPRTVYTNVSKSAIGYWSPQLSSFAMETSIKGITPFSCAVAFNNGCKYHASYSNGNQVILVSNVQLFFRRTKSIHPQGGPGYSIVRLKHDILAQSFGAQPYLHYNGLRGGNIVSLDLRQAGRRSVGFSMDCHLRQNVSQILPLRNEINVIAAYKNPGELPKILLWDIRFTNKPVLEYESNCTEDRSRSVNDLNYRFSISVDLNEEILTSVLPDLRARFWSLRSGEIIKSYPNLQNQDIKISAAAYSNDWKILDGTMGILFNVHNSGLQFYNFCNVSDDIK